MSPSVRSALVLDGHGWASRAVVASLARGGWRVLAPAGTKSARSRFCSAAVEVPDYKHDLEAFLDSVSSIIRDWEVELVVPAEDGSLELVYETPDLLGNARVLGGDLASARLALDKPTTLDRARQAGFATPETALPADPDDAVAAAQAVGFPCVIKPRRSYARSGNRLRSARLAFACEPDDVRRAVERYLRDGFDVPIVQCWVPGRSIGVATVLRHGRILGWGVREAFSQLPIRGGSAVWRATVSAAEPGVLQALALLRELKFQGLGDVQYHIAADGTPTLMEIGARTYGWLPLTIAAGADLPLICAQALDGVEPDATVVARPGLHMRWPRGELARLVEASKPGVQLPPDGRRADVWRQLWPLFGRSMLYDGVRTGDRRWFPSLTRARGADRRLRGRGTAGRRFRPAFASEEATSGES